MFGGTYEHNLDKAWRLSFPSKFKADLQGGVVVTMGMDGCLWAFTQEQWNKEVEVLSNAKDTKNNRILKRYFIGQAYETVPDKNLRVTIPARLREKIKLEKAVVLVGVGKKFEIWNAETYQDKEIELETPDTIEELYEDFTEMSAS